LEPPGLFVTTTAGASLRISRMCPRRRAAMSSAAPGPDGTMYSILPSGFQPCSAASAAAPGNHADNNSESEMTKRDCMRTPRDGMRRHGPPGSDMASSLERPGMEEKE